jgi:DEAD/DEAH box helicase domain-containing protein
VYRIIPQYKLGTSDGVSIATRPDFLFKAVESKGNEAEYREFHDIAVYLDGYQYHASKEHHRLHSDILKRKAILESNRLNVWTFTWDDVDGFINSIEKDEIFKDRLSPDHPEYNDSTSRLKQIPQWKIYSFANQYFNNSVSRFLGLLRIHDDLKAICIGVAAMRAMPTFPYPNMSHEKIDAFLSKNHAPSKVTSAKKTELVNSYLKSEWTGDFSFFSSRVAIPLKKATPFGRLWYANESLENVDKKDWNHFWSLWNLLQYGDFVVDAEESLIYKEQAVENDDLIYELYEEKFHSIIRKCLNAGIEVSEEGSYMKIYDGGFAEAKLGFDNPKVVFKPLSDRDKREFLRLGYEIANPETFDINKLLS